MLASTLPPLPILRTPIPGPRSRALASELQEYESPNITYCDDRFPIFWEAASGAMVQDVDGNTFLDGCAAFGVAAVGHCHPRVVEALQRQADVLIHGMGDVHPPALKVALARRLAALAPGDLQQVIFGSDGSDAVEAALKTAMVSTGRPGVIAFYGAYHGLSYGGLNLTARRDFRQPFLAQSGRFTTHLPYPDCFRCPWGKSFPDCGMACLETVEAALIHPASGLELPGAVIIEPIQGRAGIIEPPPGWYRALRELCHLHGVLLIADEIFTGCGRTGAWFASEEPPDLLCVGKALGGGFPISACIGTPQVMAAWGRSTGEAIHTSTFLGSPLGCAAALAVLDAIEEEGMLEQCKTTGKILKEGLEDLKARCDWIGDVRGRGLMLGIELVHEDKTPWPEAAIETMAQCLQRGLIVLPAGSYGSVVELTPAFTISRDQVNFALQVLEEALSAAALTLSVPRTTAFHPPGQP